MFHEGMPLQRLNSCVVPDLGIIPEWSAGKNLSKDTDVGRVA